MNSERRTCSCKFSDAWRCAVDQNLTSVSCPCGCHRAPVATSTTRKPLLTPEDMERALGVVSRPEFWCRSKLFQALEGARAKGVLEECLGEMDVPDDVTEKILEHLEQHWQGGTK
jgi:hypothetical protein